MAEEGDDVSLSIGSVSWSLSLVLEKDKTFSLILVISLFPGLEAFRCEVQGFVHPAHVPSQLATMSF